MAININKYGDGVPLVLFHGWGFDSHVWLSLIPQLILNYQLILVDLPGFGASSYMSWNCFKEQLLSQLPEKFALLGWSMGGLYAIRIAIEEPKRVLYLIGVSSSPRFLQAQLWPGVPKAVFLGFYQKLSLDPQTTLKEFLHLNGLKIVENGHFSEKIPSLKGLESGLKTLETWDFREEMKQLNMPVCFMFGQRDRIVPIETMSSMQSAYPDFSYVLFNRAAHIPFLSHVDLFIEKIRGFIR